MNLKTSFLAPLFAAFTLFSVIPAPHMPWQQDTLRRMLHWFPLIGVVQGAVWYGIFIVSRPYFSDLVIAVLLLLSTLIITGAIHYDGFADTCDAIGSRRPVARQLEIMKDSHVGVFAVISLIVVCLLQVALWQMIVISNSNYLLIGIGGVIGRCLTGLMVLALPKARADGLAVTLSQYVSDKNTIIQICLLLLFTCLTYAFGGVKGILCAVASLGVCAIGIWRMTKYFGGVTGDIAGFWLVIFETLWLFVLVVSK